MTLEEIVQSRVQFTRNSKVTVKINRSLSWVDIVEDGHDEGVFMQGDEADTFINELDKLSEQLPDVDSETLELSMAYDYLHILAEM